LLDNLEILRSQKAKLELEHAVERLIDSFAEGLIEKDQFASRMARTKSRIADLDTGIKAYAGDLDQREHLRLTTNRLRELAATVGPELGSADWQRKREIVRTVVQRIDIDTDVIKIIFRINQNTRALDSDAIAISVPRPSKRFRSSG
jgi:site-specific DNA recombinase